jgi:hypothetical protein
MITTRSFQRHARWAERTSEHILTRRLDEGWGTTMRLDRHAARDGLRLEIDGGPCRPGTGSDVRSKIPAS